MDQTLQRIRDRYARRVTFFQAVVEMVCRRCVAVLTDNTPGHSLPQEWTYTVAVSGDAVTGRVFTKRLDRTDQNWELILTWLNWGTRSHWIEPVRAQALHWKGADGKDYFSKGHLVSGILPAHFVERCDREILELQGKVGQWWTDYMNTGRLPA